MPNRILRDAILTSEAVNSLDVHAENFYRRLMSVVDDFGRFDGRDAILRSHCYPLKVDRVREADIARWKDMCQKAGVIVLYEVAGKPYVWMPKTGEARAKHSKYPEPPATILRAYASTCEQAHAYAPYSYSDSSTDSNAQGNAAHSCSEPPAASEPVAGIPPFPVVGGARTWTFTLAHLARLTEAFPHLDVTAQARIAQAWCVDNPPKRKTARGMGNFLLAWMGRSQNGGRASGPGRDVKAMTPAQARRSEFDEKIDGADLTEAKS